MLGTGPGLRGCCGTSIDGPHLVTCTHGYRAANAIPDPVTGALKADLGKPRFDLVPVHPVTDVARVLTYGAAKYEDRNWEKGFDYGRVYAALQRHLMAWWSGEDLDPESGLPHTAHALCCLMFLSEFEHTGAGTDNRPKGRG